jgi:alpha-L-rhamnosidase
MSPMLHRMAALALLVLVVWGQPSTVEDVADWPPITHETRPWTRWWWLGSAVDEAGLTAELEALRAAGLGGVEITPIYGAVGAESRFVPFLSARWMQLLEHALREAQRVGLGVDMATGTGWPFGGPWVGERDACRSLLFKTWTVDGGAKLAEPVRLTQTPLVRALGNQVYEVRETSPGDSAPAGTAQQPALRSGARAIQIGDLKDPVEANANLQALALEQVRYPKAAPLLVLVAYPRSGEPVNLTSRVDPAGTLQWVAPPGTWTLYGVFLGWHGKLVERAAPGGEGNVIDHFSRDAIRRYLAAFDRGFGESTLSGLRAFFNDSYEVDDATGQADGTSALFDEFQRRRGYDLRAHLPALVESERDDAPQQALGALSASKGAGDRVRADYRETVSDLLLATFTSEWSAWAKKRGRIVRNQAHGSPANLLDLYAASDIPETEGNELPRFKWATSAAHVAGRRLVAAEAATWLGEHFRSTLADVRAAVDRFFVAGVNHIVYHGTAYSPRDEPWPGWQFYASVEFNPRNPWWSDFSALNAYVSRVQSFLQAGEPDQDVLLYYPFHDALGTSAGRLTHFGGANAPDAGAPFEEAAAALQRRGFTYDYISDRQLGATQVSAGRLRTSGGGSYKTLILPASRHIPLETFERVLAFARDGATVIAFKELPSDVAGLADLDRRRASFAKLVAEAAAGPPDPNGVGATSLGRGDILHGSDLDRLLARAGVAREPLVDRGLEFSRRRVAGGRVYFIVNNGGQERREWVALADRSASAVIFDPMRGRRGDASVRQSAGGTVEVFLTLGAGESLIVQTSARVGEAYTVREAAGPPIDVRGPWTVRFVAGGPELPATRTIDQLGSWTRFGGDDVKRFSGTAVYTVHFPRPAGNADAWQLDLGRVHESARISLNGRDLGTLIGPSSHITLDAAWLAAENRLAVHVTNLSANRIAALDRAGVRWKKFYNVNFPARFPQNRGADGLFTAATWEPLDSGLLGPVTLTPLRAP